MTKLLIVDDSALMRKFLRDTFTSEGDFEICTARNGANALEALKEFNPDVITLDINMPEMDGLTCLSRIMIENPKPVVMISSLTQRDAAPTLEALALGAVDYVAKPGGTISLNMETIQKEIVKKVRAAARARIRRAKNLTARLQSQRAEHESTRISQQTFSSLRPSSCARLTNLPGLLLVGASTGGPRTLDDVLPLLPVHYPFPVVLCIHMPGSFTGLFARRLGQECNLQVVEVDKLMPLAPGTIYVAKGDHDLVISRKFRGLLASPVATDERHPWHPSVDRMVDTALQHFDPKLTTGVLLTGMGFDGAEAMARLRQAGGHTVAESEESAVVFGMPKELIERGGAEVVLPSHEITKQLVKWAR